MTQRIALSLVALLALFAVAACENSGGNTVFVTPGTDTGGGGSQTDTSAPKDVAGTTPWNDAGVTMPATLKDPSGAEIDAISAIHIVGVPPAGSPCPTPLGTLTIVNNSTVDATVNVQTADIVAIGFGPAGAQTVAPGASLTIDVFFTCDSTDDIDTMLNVAITDGTDSNDFSVPLVLDVQMP